MKKQHFLISLLCVIMLIFISCNLAGDINEIRRMAEGRIQEPADPVTCTVKFYDGETEISDLTVSIFSGSVIDLPEREDIIGTTFVGWQIGGEGKGYNGKYTVTGDTSFYSRWLEGIWNKIYTNVHVYGIRENLSENHVMMNDISLASYNNWMPIGSEDTPFTGNFDGNGYKITGLSIERTNYLTDANIGLFAYMKGTTTTRVTVANLGISTSANGVKGHSNVGGISGYAERINISNCYFEGKIEAISNVGGLVGNIYGGSDIKNCYSSGSVTGNFNAGGIAGFTESTIIYIDDCYSKADVITTNMGGSAGGITGYMKYGRISNCYSEGDIESKYKDAGGIAGYQYYGTINYCYSTGNITTFQGDSAGGITGQIDFGTINYSYSTGIITAGQNCAGGIAGQMTGGSTVANCYSTATIIAVKNNAGGLAGYSEGGNSIITNCYSKGDIKANINSAGGIAGEVKYTFVSSCYSTANVTAENRSGGLVGSVLNESFISNCAAINQSVKAITGDAGRIAGFSITPPFSTYSDPGAIIINNNFALDTMTESDGVGFNTDICYHGVDRNENDFNVQETYSDAVNGNGLGGLGWFFNNYNWKMPESGGYPILYWQ